MVDPTPLGAAVALLPAVATVLSHLLLAFENLKFECKLEIKGRVFG